MSFTPIATPKPVVGKVLIHEFVALDASGKPFWYFLSIDPSRSQEFEAAIKQAGTNGEIDVTKYGEVIAAGEGSKIPDDVREEVHAKYKVAA